MTWKQGVQAGALAAFLTGIVGCSSNGQRVTTTTGLPYYPPGPVTMVDPPAGFVASLPARPIGEAAFPTAVSSAQVPTGPGEALPPTRGIDDNAWRVDAARWAGTPYRRGGDSHRGIDCSGYVYHLYQEVAGMTIPRSSGELWEKGQAMGIADLRPGDLVFFQTVGDEEVSHVGVSLGGRDFTHTSTSKGVTISSLDEPYWNEHYTGARRLLQRQ